MQIKVTEIPENEENPKESIVNSIPEMAMLDWVREKSSKSSMGSISLCHPFIYNSEKKCIAKYEYLPDENTERLFNRKPNKAVTGTLQDLIETAQEMVKDSKLKEDIESEIREDLPEGYTFYIDELGMGHICAPIYVSKKGEDSDQ
jgi:hypothetical protein